MKAGPRNRKIEIQRATTTTDEYGGEVSAWATYCTEWAGVTFGTGQERRQAAQEQSSLTATFFVLDNAKTRAVKTTDRISFDGGFWDIASNVPSKEFNAGRDISAVRNVE